MRILFWILGVTNVGNGLWMLFVPGHWYEHLPAGVPDTGPLNAHFVRDIGAAFLTIGIVFCVAAPDAPRRRGVVLGAGLFFVLHALIHVVDLVTGRLHADHWLIDLPGVFLPAILLIVLALPPWWNREATT